MSDATTLTSAEARDVALALEAQARSFDRDTAPDVVAHRDLLRRTAKRLRHRADAAEDAGER